jgi:peptidoglycan/LPS O-acetylase OafA/YrhL
MGEVNSNSFNQMRLILALIVLFGHGAWVIGFDGESVIQLGKIPITYFAVYCFFVISGYLVGPKIEQYGVRTFIIRRSARIYPAYAGVIILTATLFSTIWQAQKTIHGFGVKKQLAYLFLNLIPFPGLFSQGQYSPFFLMGQPQGVRLTGLINIPLWTLAWECLAYLSLVILYLLSTRLKKSASHAFLITLMIMYGVSILWSLNNIPYQSNQADFFGALLQKWPYFLCFFSGAVVSTSARFYRIPRPFLILSLFLLIVSTNSIFLFAAFGALSLTHLAISIGESKVLSRIPIKIDISYGLYLYHFPIMQTLAHYSYFDSHVIYFLICSLLASVVFAYASAKFLENPVLRFAKSYT